MDCNYFRHKKTGVVMMELALVMPIFLLILFFIFQGCAYFYFEQALSSAAFHGGRYLAVNQISDCSDLETEVRSHVIDQYLQMYAIPPENVTVEVSCSSGTQCNCTGSTIAIKLKGPDTLAGLNVFNTFAISVFRKEGIVGNGC